MLESEEEEHGLVGRVRGAIFNFPSAIVVAGWGGGGGERGANTPFDTTSAEAASLLRWFSAVGRKCDIIVTQMNAQLILPRRGKLSRAANRRRTAECAKRRNGPPITMWAIHSQTYQLLANC